MEKYLMPEMEVVKFDSEDVITTSCPPDTSCPPEDKCPSHDYGPNETPMM